MIKISLLKKVLPLLLLLLTATACNSNYQGFSNSVENNSTQKLEPDRKLNTQNTVTSSPDAFDGKTYTNTKYGFSFSWTGKEGLYLTSYDWDENGQYYTETSETPGAVSANYSLTRDAASGDITIQITRFSDLSKNQKLFCDEQIMLNPGTIRSECAQGVTQEQIVAMRRDLQAKKLTSNIVFPGDRKNTTPQFMNITGGTGVFATLYDFNGGWWMAHFITLNKNNDVIEIYLNKPTATTVAKLIALPEYTAFKKVMSTFAVIDK